jgi:hypothetical protein
VRLRESLILVPKLDDCLLTLTFWGETSYQLHRHQE